MYLANSLNMDESYFFCLSQNENTAAFWVEKKMVEEDRQKSLDIPCSCRIEIAMNLLVDDHIFQMPLHIEVDYCRAIP